MRAQVPSPLRERVRVRVRLHSVGWLLAAGMLALAACSPSSSAPATSAPAPAAKPTTALAAAPTNPPTAAAAAKPTSAPAAAPTTTAGAAPTSAPAATAKPTSAPAPASTAAAAPSGPEVSLSVSYSNLIADNLPEWMAYESGIFKQHGLNVTLQNIASSTGIPALLSGQIEIAHLGGSETLSAAAEGGDLVIIAITGPVYPFVFMASQDIQT